MGGDPDVFQKVEPILAVIARKTVLIGSSRMGNTLKLLNNMMVGAINTITSEIRAASAKLGLEPQVLFETIADSGAATVGNLFKELGIKMYNRDFEPIFSVDLLHKTWH